MFDLEAWIMGSFTGYGPAGKSINPSGGKSVVERCERDGRRGLAVLSHRDYETVVRDDPDEPRFRHILAWVWDEAAPVLFAIMLNPSTARAFVDDQTMKKLIQFAKLGGYGAVVVINLYDFRATKPAVAKAAGWPSTGYNRELLDRVLNDLAEAEGEDRRDVLLAWGDNGPTAKGWAVGRKRDWRVRLVTLGLTKKGKPEHPCMIPYSRELLELAA